MIEPGHTVMRGKAFQAGAHAVHGRLKIGRIQINHCDREMVTMMKLFLPQQAPLKAVD